ncbi:MAG: gliding motility lipoprotein GldH [Bacteroidales bacterium]|nr:gliding motility lipoprotein GldH [Bacteroidales bacterium]
MIGRIPGFLILPALLFFPVSCDRNMVYDEFHVIENASWHWDDQLEFSFDMHDTIHLHNIFIRLRHTTDYPLSNLYMFIDVRGPSGQSMRDTVNFVVAEKSGRWIGSGVGNIREIDYLYRKNAIFPDTGTYKIFVEQAMRVPELPVQQLGIRVEQAEP